MTFRKVLYAPHFQYPPPGWRAIFKLEYGVGMAKVVEGFEMAAEIKAENPNVIVVARHVVDDTGRWLNMCAQSEEQAYAAMVEYVATFKDALIANQDHIDIIEGLNEEYPTANLGKLHLAIRADRAFIRVISDMNINVKPGVFTAAVGNPDHHEFPELFPLMRDIANCGGYAGYHAYWSVIDGKSSMTSEKHQRDHHMRWNEFDKQLMAEGIYVNWYLGEAGPIGSYGRGDNWGYGLLANDGWRHRGVYGGALYRVLEDLRAFDKMIVDTEAYKQGRFDGYVLFTTGLDPKWKHFLLTSGDWHVLSSNNVNLPLLPPIGSPPDPEPEPEPEIPQPEDFDTALMAQAPYLFRVLVEELPTNGHYAVRDLEGLEAHVVHHTATLTATPQSIANYHVNTLGWPGSGYTYVITEDGVIYQVNWLEAMSSGVWRHNSEYLSTCLVGDFRSDRVPTTPQLDSLYWLHHEYIPAMLGRKLPLLGHKECKEAATECPGYWDWHRAIEGAQEVEDFREIVVALRIQGAWASKKEDVTVESTVVPKG